MMRNGAPRVTVLLPVFNGGKFFATALRSILDQTFTDLECLVIDDGSTDDSAAVASEAAHRDRRVRLIQRENRGLVATLNEGVACARAPLVARMDADDVALPDRLQRQVAFLDEHPQVVCVGGGHWLIDEVDRIIAPLSAPARHVEIDALSLKGHTAICHPAATMRVDAIRQAGGYRQDFYPTEDLDLWLRLAEVGELANLPVPVIRYRVHTGSISGQAALGRQRDAAERSCRAAWSRRGLVDQHFEGAAPWRVGESRSSRLEFALRYGWMAWSAGIAATARAYGRKAVAIDPLDAGAWRLLTVASFKKAPVADQAP